MIGKNPSGQKGPNLPVEFVAWDEAQAGPSSGKQHGLRGGGRNNGPGNYRVSVRGRFGAGRLNFGFRCVASD